MGTALRSSRRSRASSLPPRASPIRASARSPRSNVASGASASTRTVIGTGFCGALTTYSAFALEATEGDRRHRIAVVGVSLAAGLSAAALGYQLG